MKIKFKVLLVFLVAIFSANIVRSMSIDELIQLVEQKPVNVNFMDYIDEQHSRCLMEHDKNLLRFLRCRTNNCC